MSPGGLMQVLKVLCPTQCIVSDFMTKVSDSMIKMSDLMSKF